MRLDVDGINSYYGLSHILFDVTLHVGDGEVVTLLGRNGAGKTTTLRSIMGLLQPRSGFVRYRGRDVTTWAAYRKARLGLGFVPEDRRIFPDLSVRENLEVAAKPGHDGSTHWSLQRVFGVFPRLEGLAGRQGGHLSGGEQQMLTIARSLMGNPELLLLDEPSEGLAPAIVDSLRDQVLELKAEGVCILLCEQNFQLASQVSDRAYIIESGHIRYEGPMSELRTREDVLQAHLAV